jgi:glycosyltransferase involved in cell wall biosynthesis
MPEPAPLVVFSDDWGRHPSSCQHLIRHLLPRRRVAWVNTIGTRPPRLDWLTLKRGFGKLAQWVGLRRGAAHRPVADAVGWPEPTVLNPKMWPSFRSRLGRGLNRRLLMRALRTVTETGPAPVLVTTLPLVADLVGRVRAARWVYYCVDDFSVWPGLDGRTLQALEAELVPKVDVVVAVSETLQAHIAKLGKPSHLLTHGVDLEFWRKPVAGDGPPSLSSLTDTSWGPLVVFWGVIDRRMDSHFIRRLAEVMHEGRILLVGPQDNPDPELLQLPRVRALPPVPYADLPALAARTRVLVAPYADLPVTRAMQPLKFKEYLATGLPVVARRLPATEEWADCADVVDTPEAFAAAVLARLEDGVPEAQCAARSRLDAEGWSAKAAQFEHWLDGGE